MRSWLAMAVLLSGCALMLGKSYTRFDPVPGGMGVIYIYAGDILSLQHVHVDRDPTTDGITHTISMVKNGYYPYLTPAGLVRVLSGPADSASCVLLEVQPNSQHWVRVSKGAPRVIALAQQAAEKEIAGHREISRESQGPGTGTYPAEDCPLAP